MSETKEVRKFDELTTDLNELYNASIRQSLEANRLIDHWNNVLQQDVTDMLNALNLGDHARPQSTHEVIQNEIIPKIQELMKHTPVNITQSGTLDITPIKFDKVHFLRIESPFELRSVISSTLSMLIENQRKIIHVLKGG